MYMYVGRYYCTVLYCTVLRYLVLVPVSLIKDSVGEYGAGSHAEQLTRNPLTVTEHITNIIPRIKL
jgi:hypothetical protein